MAGESEFARVLAESLRVAWREGAVHDSPAGTCTGWRIMPTTVCSVLLDGRSLLEIEGQPAREYRTGMGICIPEGVHHRVTNTVRGVSAWAHLSFRVFGAVDVLTLVEVPPVISGPAALRLGELCRQLADVAGTTTGMLGQ